MNTILLSKEVALSLIDEMKMDIENDIYKAFPKCANDVKDLIKRLSIYVNVVNSEPLQQGVIRKIKELGYEID